MDKDYSVRGEMVKYHRKRKRMSQQRLAEKSGLSLGQISRIEGGKIETPHFSTIAKIAAALGVDEDDLIDFLMQIPA